MSATADWVDTRVDVTVGATPLPPVEASALGVYTALRDRFGAGEVFLFEDLRPDGIDRREGTVVGVGRLVEISVTGDRITVSGTGAVADRVREVTETDRGRVWDLLRSVMRLFHVHTDLPANRFAFGFLTTIAYDAAALMEELPPRTIEPDVPDLALTLFQHTIWFDGDTTTLIAASGQELPRPLTPDELPRWESPAPVPAAPVPLSVNDTVTEPKFLEWVRRCLGHIRVGDIYQIQVGHRIDVRTELTPTQVYRRLRHRNPSPYMYLATQSGTTLIGASPELLFRLADGQVVMRPIAGTIRKDPTGTDNARRIDDLVGSVKEQAEHVMLVDLCRNDLSRVCRPGTLSVDALMTVEAFSHVYHLVSTVTGETHADVWDVLCATFPAGTMTGAPKLRAMEIIDELEEERRGAYAGAVGLVDVRGWAELALCIRTITHQDGRYSTQSCAGVVALSDPAREWDETLAKMGPAYWALTGEELA